MSISIKKKKKKLSYKFSKISPRKIQFFENNQTEYNKAQRRLKNK